MLKSSLSLGNRKISDDDREFANLPRVKLFLDSVGRNSLKSKANYFSGLRHLNNYVSQTHPVLDELTNTKNGYYDIESILAPLSKNEINVYALLDSFISYLLEERKGITAGSIQMYIAAIRSYLAFNDIDVISAKFKRKVKMPKSYREDEEPIDASDIRKILLSCNNRRLKTLLLILASGAMRVSECLAIRDMDIDFSVSPTKIKLRKEYSKTRRARDVYISDEATKYLKQWLDWKYNNPDRKREYSKEDLVFTVTKTTNTHSIYVKVWHEFDRLLKTVEMADRKEEAGIQNRKKITIHSLRRHAKTVVSEQAGTDYSEFFLGHEKSPYWTMKEEKRREIYATKVMKYLTFLDYQSLESTGKNIEAKLSQKDLEVQYLRQRDLKHETDMVQMQNQLDKILSIVQANPKLANVKKEILSEI